MDKADMAGDLIDARDEAALAAARGVVPPSIAVGKPSACDCDRCGETIPQARRVALPGVRLCRDCAEAIELTLSMRRR